MSHAQRLKDLQKSWKNEKPASGGRSSHPLGNYQGTIVKCSLEEGKKGKQLGHLLVRCTIKGLSGEAADKLTWNSIDLHYPGRKKTKDQSAVPSGLARFKGFLQDMTLDIPADLSEKSIRKVCEKVIGSVVDYAVVQSGQYTNTYINRLVNAPEIDDDELDDTEDEFEEVEPFEADDEDDEDINDDDPVEEEEEEAPPPPKKRGRPKGSKNKKATKKKAVPKKPKKAAPVVESEDSDDDEEWGDDWE